MSVGVRLRLSIGEVEELWQRYRGGESVSAIARSLTRSLGSVYGILRDAGGFSPRVRQRSARALSSGEREEISRLLAAGASFGKIAAWLGRAVSTVSREVARNGGRDSYRARAADCRAAVCARRPKLGHLARRRRLARVVACKLRRDWSPQQISAWLKREYGGIVGMQVSHETIYKSLFVQARGELRRELTAHLRSRRRMRRARTAGGRGQGRGQIVDAISIRERPAEAADRAVPGHWEGDLLVGAHNSYIITLVERASRYVMLMRTSSKDSATVTGALAGKIKCLPEELRRSLTWDRGAELAMHKELTLAADIDVYFCDPKSPWQRGSNENTNGLLRQYFPKGTDLGHHRQPTLDRIARLLNTRPRKTLGFQTPSQRLNTALALTA